MRFKLEIPLVSGGNLKNSQTVKCGLSLITREVEVPEIHSSDMALAFTLFDKRDQKGEEYYEFDDQLYVAVGALGAEEGTVRYIGKPICNHPFFYEANQHIKFRMGQDEGSAHSKNRFIPAAVGWAAARKEPPAELSYRFPDHAELMASGNFGPWAGTYEEQMAAVEKRLQRFVLLDGKLMQRVMEPLFVAKGNPYYEMTLTLFKRDEGQRLRTDSFQVDNELQVLSLRDMVGPGSRYEQFVNGLQQKGRRVPEECRFDINIINHNRFSRSAEGANILIAAKAVLETAKTDLFRDTRDVLSTVSVREYSVLHEMYHAVKRAEAQEDETLIPEELEQALHEFLDVCNDGHNVFRAGTIEKTRSALVAWEDRSVELLEAEQNRRCGMTGNPKPKG